ncbi:hypothetical protein AXYL_05222 [Achromobacter xylosoxidans A8]|uniref:BD-FAE-like domain-containing protein n=1 Tax=Achromobacter xylosoxidans (strain A8) TaxID=762376 RepID=E3HSS1_ACHXA|nr:alpha/beta hydrolase [Achromobacter xylosoxidans]ADP18522.1 hypothetical protein AXYL_05222 [Achromobacter xylosoxidans A8]
MTCSSQEQAIDPEQEAQYNLRARHPEREEIYFTYARRSADTRSRPEARLDLRFGQRASSVLDLFVPDHVPAPPLLVFIHGGYWRALDKHGFSFIADEYLARGVAVALPNYTLAPHASVSDIVDEACTAVSWLTAQGERHGYDASRIVLSGHSAGGHMAARALCRDLVPALAGRIRGYVGLSGLFDLEPLLRTSINRDLHMSVSEARNLGLYQRAALYEVPMVFAAGALETEGFRGQSRDFSQHCASHGYQVENLVVPQRNHFDLLTDFAGGGYPLFNKTLDLLLPGAGRA